MNRDLPPLNDQQLFCLKDYAISAALDCDPGDEHGRCLFLDAEPEDVFVIETNGKRYVAVVVYGRDSGQFAAVMPFLVTRGGVLSPRPDLELLKELIRASRELAHLMLVWLQKIHGDVTLGEVIERLSADGSGLTLAEGGAE